jgi:recombinational DNA repair ATPase RecF
MKIKKLKLTNFAKFTDFECEFSDKVTHLVGVNGSGKTTIGLTAIWANLKGIAERSKDSLLGERFRFIGNQKATADLEMTVYDEQTGNEVVIKNHISKATNQITCEPVQDANWLNELLSVAFLSAKNFTQLDSKKQALLLGIDASKFDEQIQELKTEYTLLNREFKNIGELEVAEKVEKIDVVSLVKQKETIESEYYNKQRIIEDHNRKVVSNQRNIEDTKRQIAELEDKIQQHKEWLKNNPEIKPKDSIPEPDLSEIKEKLETAEKTNQQAEAYSTYIAKYEKKCAKQSEINENKLKQTDLETKRLEYIKKFSFGFDGLSVDESGGLTLNGRPIKDPYFSKGEIELIVAQLYASLNPEFKVRFIDDFELLDEDNQAKILDALLDQGFQVITAEVGKKKVKDNTILLKECKQVDSYQDKGKKLI